MYKHIYPLMRLSLYYYRIYFYYPRYVEIEMGTDSIIAKF